jgi:uncharacterized protein (DUF1330 family)
VDEVQNGDADCFIHRARYCIANRVSEPGELTGSAHRRIRGHPSRCECKVQSIGSVAEFEAYERKAARIIGKYGGSIEKVIRTGQENSPDTPFEIHVVSFPGQEQFAAYRADPELLSLATDREAAILKTVVVPGAGGPAYST